MSLTVRVATVRKQAPGRTVFTGKELDRNGQAVDGRAYILVTGPQCVFGTLVEPGQWWTVDGEIAAREVEVNGFRLTEKSVVAHSATMQRLSGEHLVMYLARNPAFVGIGMVKARRLWDALGDALYDVLDNGDVATLSKYLTEDVATNAVSAWLISGNSKALKWLQSLSLDVNLGRKVLEFHGPATEERLSEDPYRLLSFCAAWKQVDEIARKTFGVQPDDPRRIKGALEEACYAAFAEGHTSVLRADLRTRLVKLLGRGSLPAANQALADGLANGSYVIGPYGLQPLGAAAMEGVVARFVANHVEPRFEIAEEDLPALIDEHERVESIQLNTEQRLAVELANRYPVAMVIGGAGVGKTTVLKAIHKVYEQARTQVIQIALAGRAAKRMQDATGRPASTVASFIRQTKPSDLELPAAVVIDEASMLDIVSMAAICERLGPSTRLLLLGDPAQLMPVGPGLVLHALVKVPSIPHVELKSVRRYGGAILAAAQRVRKGAWPALPNDIEQPISFLPCSSDEHELAALVVDLYGLDPTSTQVLVSKKSGAGGASLINAMAQQRFARTNEPVITLANELTGLHVGDTVICNRNMWDRGLQNGSIGIIRGIETTPAEQFDSAGRSTGWSLAQVEWDDGLVRPLVEEMLDDISLGYAVTVHKAQGSQWKRIIVPVVPGRALDRALLYTAITRAEEQVVLVGDEAAARDAVQSLPRAEERSVALDLTLLRHLSVKEK